MLLAIDIGNTVISLAVFKGKRIVQLTRVQSNLTQFELRSNLTKQLKSIKRKYPSVNSVIICSVVPKALKVLKGLIRKNIKIRPVIIGTDIKVPLINRYQNPRQVGQDRLVCAYAAMKIYGLPAVVVDFGTAITFDVVSKRGEYLGGIIVPGIKLSADSLFKRAALLPKIKINAPKNLIGKNTEDSILSGLFYGYGALSKGIIRLVAKRIKGKKRVVVTGGYTHLMRKFIAQEVDVIDKNLVFRGMQLLHKEGTSK